VTHTFTTDKVAHGYLPTYQRLAQTNPGYLCEIGVGNGDGMIMFDRLGWTVVGVEIDPARAGIASERTRTAVLVGDATMMEPGNGIIVDPLNPPPPFNVIVDDASHDFATTIMTMSMWWPMLAPGGVYVIEDWSHVEVNMVLAYRLWATGLARLAGPDKPFSYVEIQNRGLILIGKQAGE